MACWNAEELEYWVLNPSIHRSIRPLLQALLRWSEAIERNEAYEFFSSLLVEDGLRVGPNVDEDFDDTRSC